MIIDLNKITTIITTTTAEMVYLNTLFVEKKVCFIIFLSFFLHSSYSNVDKQRKYEKNRRRFNQQQQRQQQQQLPREPLTIDISPRIKIGTQQPMTTVSLVEPTVSVNLESAMSFVS
jgi:hypothetical protein